ncbi:MAG: insulinase family protein, partial [Massilia sp.]
MNKLMLALAVSLAFAPPLHAQTKAPNGMPAYGQEKSIPAPKIGKQTLANGLTVWVVPRQGLPRVDFVLALRGAGFAADAPTQGGFAAMLAGMLNEGTA